MTKNVICIEDEFSDKIDELGCEVCGCVMTDDDVDMAMRAMSGWVCATCLNKERREEIL